MAKRIYQGYLYDTDLSIKVGEREPTHRSPDHSYQETLYRTPGGAYFLHRVAGLASPYAEERAGVWYGIDKIVIMNAEEVREWAEDYLPVEIYQSEFGIVPIAGEGRELEHELDIDGLDNLGWYSTTDVDTSPTGLEGIDWARVAIPKEGNMPAIEEQPTTPESLESQIYRLANFIAENIPGEPSAPEGAVDTAIRLLSRCCIEQNA